MWPTCFFTLWLEKCSIKYGWSNMLSCSARVGRTGSIPPHLSPYYNFLTFAHLTSLKWANWLHYIPFVVQGSVWTIVQHVFATVWYWISHGVLLTSMAHNHCAEDRARGWTEGSAWLKANVARTQPVPFHQTIFTGFSVVKFVSLDPKQ